MALSRVFLEGMRAGGKVERQEIEAACRKGLGSGGSLERVEVLSNGAVNTSLKVLWGGEWYVLRFYLRGEHLASIERRIYGLVEGSVSVPELIYVSEGAGAFALFRWCSKPHLYEVEGRCAEEVSYDLGAVLARIHSFRFPEAGLWGEGVVFEEGSSPYLEYCLEHFTPESLAWERLGAARAERVARFIDERKGFFPVIEGGGCLVHSDFKPVNLLWREGEGVTVLDWEFAHSGAAIVDFGVLLRHFSRFPFQRVALERGYREGGGRLGMDWYLRARLVDFVNVVQFLNAPVERGELFSDLIESVELTMGAWDGDE